MFVSNDACRLMKKFKRKLNMLNTNWLAANVILGVSKCRNILKAKYGFAEIKDVVKKRLANMDPEGAKCRTNR